MFSLPSWAQSLSSNTVASEICTACTSASALLLHLGNPCPLGRPLGGAALLYAVTSATKVLWSSLTSYPKQSSQRPCLVCQAAHGPCPSLQYLLCVEQPAFPHGSRVLCLQPHLGMCILSSLAELFSFLKPWPEKRLDEQSMAEVLQRHCRQLVLSLQRGMCRKHSREKAVLLPYIGDGTSAVWRKAHTRP